MTVRTLKSKLRSGALLSLAFILLALLLFEGLAVAGEIVDAWVYPAAASTNSRRWLRIHINIPSTEGLTYLTFSGLWGTAPGLPSVSGGNWLGYDGSGQSLGTLERRNVGRSPYVTVHSLGTDYWYTIGPFVGISNFRDERPAHYPWVVGFVMSPGSSTEHLDNVAATNFYCDSGYYTLSSGEAVQRDSNDYIYSDGYQTVHDNDDTLEWFSGNASGVDPLSINPNEVIKDSGSGSDRYTFRVMYRSGLYSGIDLPPRWRADIEFADGHADRPERAWFPDYHNYTGEPYAGRRTVSGRGDPDGGWDQFNWLYSRTTDPWLDQTGYSRWEYDARGATEPKVLLVIDGQHWAPHYMLAEDPNNTDFSQGVVYRYSVAPTDYMNFLDNLFLFPFDLPGADSWDTYPMMLATTPVSNNYVAFTAGPHTYEFWATDDYAPPSNRAWVQVAWPGNDLHTEYIERVSPEARRTDGLRSAVRRSRISLYNESGPGSPRPAYTADELRRFNDVSVDQPDPYGYTLKSHAASTDADITDPEAFASPNTTLSLRKLPNVNPVLTAHPFFGKPGREGGITPALPATDAWGAPDFSTVFSQDDYRVAGGFIDNDIPNNTYVQGAVDLGSLNSPFPAETGAGPSPASSPVGPWKYTNDDTILPNLANIWNELAATPFRGGKWTDSTKYTFRVNYWHSENTAPSFMRVYIRRNDPTGTPGIWYPYTMENTDTDANYANGAVFQYEATPDQLPTNSSPMGGGVGEYDYYFLSSDRERSVRFPDRPDRYTYTDERGSVRAIDDPGDMGVPRGQTGQDYYWFRVNHKPALTNASVTPTVGRTGDPFVFQVTYTDADGEASVANALGDRPFIAHLYVDLFGTQYGQHTVAAAPSSESVLTYTNTEGHTFANNELAGLFVVMQSGGAIRKTYRIVSNTGSTINLEADPQDPDHPGKLLTDGVAQGDQLYVAQRTAMAKQDSTDDNYKDGVVYQFVSGTNMILGPGTHKYFFEFADDWGGWMYPNDPDVHVEGEYTRFPNAGAFTGPEVIANTAPQLLDYRFLPQDVTGAPDGTTSTSFIFYVTYVDQQNDPPALIQAEIDGTTGLSLTPDNPNDTVYTDGVVYKSAPIRLTEGQHFLRAQASDGEERYPPPAAYSGTTVPLMGPTASVTGNVSATGFAYTVGAAVFAGGRYDGAGITIRMLDGAAAGTDYTISANAADQLTLTGGNPATDGVAAGDRFIFDAAPGPKVAANTAPTLIFPADDNVFVNDPLDSRYPKFPGLTPDTGAPADAVAGTPATSFTYRVIYIDNDQFAGVRGNPPEFVQVYIDNVPYAMTKVDPNDNDYTDDGSGTGGAAFQFTVPSGTVPALEAAAPHTYFFIASDGLDTARLPALGALPNNRYDGPIVDGRPDPPQQLFVTDRANDNGDALQFNFSASLDDGGGADDVTEYHLYRNITGAPFANPPVMVIKATNAPSYGGFDTPATGLQKATAYFYTVRAYDGPSIDPDGDGIPGVDADSDGQPDDPIVINPIDQSVNSNIEGPVTAEDNISPGAVPTLAAADPGLGGTIDLSWTLSPDDGAGNDDVVEYRLYRNTTGAPYNPPVLVSLPAGTSSYRDQTVTDAVDYYYAIVVWDGANASAAVEAVPAPISSTDAAAPEILNLYPADAQSDVPRNANIEFDIRDTGAGIDASSIVVTATVSGQPVAGQVTTTGSGSQIHVVFNPDADFAYLVAVNVHIAVSDLAVPTANATTLDTRFTVTGPPVYSIEGTVTDRDNPAVKVPGVVLRAIPVGGGAAISATSDAAGNYSIGGLAAGVYYIVPQKGDTAFIPETSVPLSVPPSPQRADFSAVPGYDITGTVKDASDAPLVGVRVTDGVHEDLTDTNGEYSILDVAAGDYTIIPQLSGYEFTPPTEDVTVNAANPGATADFVGDVEKYTVSGTVRDISGLRLSGVTVEARNVGGQVVATAQTNTSGAYSIADLPAGFYTLRPAKTDWEFEPTTRDVDIAGDKTEIDFIGIPVTKVSLPTGLRMVALPILPRELNPALNIPAGVAIARWDPTLPDTLASKYIIGNPGSPLPEQYEMLPGRSFWMRNSNAGAVQLAVAGDPVDTDIAFSMTLERGWNMAGNMFNGALPWSNLQISGGQTVRDYGFLYNAATNNYDLVTDIPGIAALTAVPKNAGFWVKATSKRTVMVSPVASAEAPSAEGVYKFAEGDFILPVVARSDKSADTCSLAGVITGAGDEYKIENPPALSPYVDLYFTDEAGRRLACDVRAAQADVQTWNFVVATDTSGAKVEVSLPDLSGVPADKTVTLVDLTTGKRLYARTMASYAYVADQTGTRSFVLEIAPRDGNALVVSSAMARQAGGGVVVTYSLSKDATVSATVLNIGGRAIRALQAGEAGAKGVNTLSWDLKSDGGAAVPAGRYLVRINAVTEDGQAASGVASLQVTR